MAKKPEATYRNSIHKKLPTTIYKASVGGAYVAGVPDVYYEAKRKAIWIEWKYYQKLPPTIDLLDQKKSVKVSVLQKRWLDRAWENNKNAYVICGSPQGGRVYTPMQLTLPIQREQFVEEALTRDEVAQWIIDLLSL